MLFYTENVMKFAFAKEAADTDEENLNSASIKKFGIIGVPFDSTASYRPGARFGPRFVREASYNFERYNLILDKTIDAQVYDFGDLEVVHGNFKKTCFNLKTTVSELMAMEFVPIIIGGDHSISYCVLKAIAEDEKLDDIENITVIHLDAHMDLRDLYMGEKYSHATVMRRIYDLNPLEILQIGVRSASMEEANFANENGLITYQSENVHENLDEIIESIKKIEGPIYLTLDIDVLDPAYAPDVGTPSPCGLNPKQVEKLIYSLKDKNIIGFDMVEVSSNQIGDITSLNAAKLIYDFLSIQ